MRFRIEFSAEAVRDFALIFDHLFESYIGFGELLIRRWIIARPASAISGTKPTGWQQHRFAA